MSKKMKHLGMLVIGIGCLAAAAFIPPLAPVLGPLGTKAVIAAGGGFLLATNLAHIKTPTA